MQCSAAILYLLCNYVLLFVCIHTQLEETVETLQAQVQSLEGVAEKRETASTALQEKMNSLTSDLQAKVQMDRHADKKARFLKWFVLYSYCRRLCYSPGPESMLRRFQIWKSKCPV